MLLRWSLLLKVMMVFAVLTMSMYVLLSPRSKDQSLQNVQHIEWHDRPIHTKQPYAYMNLCANLRAVFPTLVLFEQLQRLACHRGDYVVILPEWLNEQVGYLFKSFGIRRLLYDDSRPLFPISYPVLNPSTLQRDVMLWQKLRAWNASEYKKVVFLDNDILVSQNIDDLFQFHELSGVPQLYDGEKVMFWEPKILDKFIPISPESEWESVNRDGLNGGVMVIEPNVDTFHGLVKEASGLTNRTCCPSQEFLFRYYQKRQKYTRLPMEYNARKLHKLSVKRQHLQNIKVYHFVEKSKPLLLGRRESQNDVMARGWWQVADLVDDLLDEYVRANVNAFSVVLRIREAAISQRPGS